VDKHAALPNPRKFWQSVRYSILDIERLFMHHLYGQPLDTLTLLSAQQPAGNLLLNNPPCRHLEKHQPLHNVAAGEKS